MAKMKTRKKTTKKKANKKMATKKKATRKKAKKKVTTKKVTKKKKAASKKATKKKVSKKATTKRAAKKKVTKKATKKATKKVTKKATKKKTTPKKSKATKDAKEAAALKLEGQKAPDFTLKDKDANTHTLTAVDSDFTVLFFYPKDDTPGCTIESKSFSDNLAKFSDLKAKVYGISGGNEKTKTKFVDKCGLHVDLLSDPDFEVSKKFLSYGEKSFMGRKYKGIFRYTFVLDKDKKVIKVFDKVKPPTHVQEVLDYLNSL